MYFSELARDVMAAAEPHGWTLIIQQTSGRRQSELSVLNGASRQLSDGLLFQPHALAAGDETELTGHQPLVLLGDRIFDGPVDHVTMANRRAAEAAIQYLIDRGRRRIAVIGTNPAGGPISAAGLRYAGYTDAHAANGLAVPTRLAAIAIDWHQSDGALAMDRLLDEPERPDAVFCFNDSLAFGAIHTLAERGIRVPEEVAVVGFDNVAGSAYSNPSLTTIDPGRPQIAKTAVDLLARRFSGLDNPPTEVVANFSLVARRSA